MTIKEAEALLSLLNVFVREKGQPDEYLTMARRLSQCLYGTLLSAELTQSEGVGNNRLPPLIEGADRNVIDEAARREREIK